MVDNASSDGSAELLKTRFPQVSLIENQENLGFARANNQAIVQSRGQHILLLNADTLVFPNAFDKMVDFMRAHPQTGALGCLHLDASGRRRYLLGGRSPNLLTMSLGTLSAALTDGRLGRLLVQAVTALRSKRGTDDANSGAHYQAREVDLIDGCGFMTKREVVNTVGMFNEAYYLGSEDAEWCQRIKDAGWEIWLLENAQIVHYGLQSYSQSDMAAVHYCKGEYQFLKERYGTPQAVLYRLLVPLMMLTGIALRSIWYLVASQQQRPRLAKRRQDFWRIFLWSVGALRV